MASSATTTTGVGQLADSSVLLHHSSTRRKACTGCVKAKRRCDLRFPECTRCSKRRVRCVYVGCSTDSPTCNTQPPATTTQPSHTPPDPLPALGPLQNSIPLSFQPNFNLYTIPVDVSIVDDTFDNAFPNLNDNGLVSESSESIDDAYLDDLVHFDDLYGIANYPTFWNRRPFTDFAAHQNGPHQAPPTPSPWADQCLPVTKAIAVVSRDQLLFCKNELRTFIPMLVQSGHTPFIHKLVRAKSPIENVTTDLFGSCALYMAKCPQNAAVVDRVLEAKMETLRTQSQAWTTLPEWLYGLQALIMYQIMRLFDYDPRQRARGQRDIPMMLSWVEKMKSVGAFLSIPDTIPSPMNGANGNNDCPDQTQFIQPETMYRAGPDPLTGCNPFNMWVAAESVRRTVLMALFVPTIYNSLRQGYCDTLPQLRQLSVTADSANLWASTEEEWWRRTFCGAREGANVLPYEDFVMQWSAGQVKEIGRFERVLLAVCKGRIAEGKFVLQRTPQMRVDLEVVQNVVDDDSGPASMVDDEVCT